MSISEEKEQPSQQLDPQEELVSLAISSPKTQWATGKLLARTRATIRNDESRWTTWNCERKGRIRQNSLQRHVFQNWWGDLGILLHHAVGTLYPGLWSKTSDFQVHRDGPCSRCQNYLSTQMFMESGDKTKVWVSYPEARIVTWMSYDTEPETLREKSCSRMCARSRWESYSRWEVWRPYSCSSNSLRGLARQWTQLRIQVGNRSLEILSVNWYDMSISRERETDGAIHWTFISTKLQVQIPTLWRKQFHWQRLDQLHPERMQPNNTLL